MCLAYPMDNSPELDTLVGAPWGLGGEICSGALSLGGSKTCMQLACLLRAVPRQGIKSLTRKLRRSENSKIMVVVREGFLEEVVGDRI